MYKKIIDMLIIFFILFNLYYMYVIDENEKQKINQKNEIEYDLNYYKDYYSNEDIIGKIKIDGTSIDTFLVKSSNNEYYLNHSIRKEYDIKGSIFVDYRTDLNSRQINIYGHNSIKYDLPFKELEKYMEKSFYDEHKIIKIWNGEVINNYEIFSVQVVTRSYEHMKIDSKNYKQHLKLLSNSIYKTNVDVTENDDILILQTCNYNPKNSYILVIAKKV